MLFLLKFYPFVTKNNKVTQTFFINFAFRLETEEKLTKSELDIVKGLILCIAFAANIGGIATINGTPPNLVFMGQLET